MYHPRSSTRTEVRSSREKETIMKPKMKRKGYRRQKTPPQKENTYTIYIHYVFYVGSWFVIIIALPFLVHCLSLSFYAVLYIYQFFAVAPSSRSVCDVRCEKPQKSQRVSLIYDVKKSKKRERKRGTRKPKKLMDEIARDWRQREGRGKGAPTAEEEKGKCAHPNSLWYFIFVGELEREKEGGRRRERDRGRGKG